MLKNPFESLLEMVKDEEVKRVMIFVHDDLEMASRIAQSVFKVDKPRLEMVLAIYDRIVNERKIST
jgi:predicted site-specific integrase-resolvase